MLRPEVQPLPPPGSKKSIGKVWVYLSCTFHFSLRTFLQFLEKATLEGFRIQVSVIMRHRSIPTASSSPGYYGAFARLFQSRGWGISKFCAARGSGICQPRGHPRAFDTHVVSYPNITLYGGFYQKTRRLAHLLRTGKIVGIFSILRSAFLHYVKPEIGSYGRESTFFRLLNQISVYII